MSGFVNTIDSLGDNVALVAFIERTIPELKDNVLPTIGDYTFNYCANLTIVDLPNATSIGREPFAFCTKLATVNLPNVTSISYGAFKQCDALALIDLPKVTSIYEMAFYYCDVFATLILRSETMCTLANVNALEGTPMYSTGYIYVPSALVDTYKADSVWAIYSERFRALEDYTIDGTVDGIFLTDTTTYIYNESVTSIPEAALRDNAVLEEVYFPNVTSIGSCAFQNCSALTIVDCPNLTTLEASAFNSCSALTSVDFPSLTQINGTNVFYNCTNLKALILRSATVCEMDSTISLSGTPIQNGTGYIYVPRALIDSYKSATNWNTTYLNQFRALEDYTVDGTITGKFDTTKI